MNQRESFDEDLEVLGAELRRLRTPMPPEALVSRVRSLAHLQLAGGADERLSRWVMGALLLFSWTISIFIFLTARLVRGDGLLASMTGSTLSWPVVYFVLAWISGVALLAVLGFHARKERRLA